MEFECENLTTLGCERMDSVKELQLVEMIESWYFDADTLCKNQCCKDCDRTKNCSYTCGRISWKDPAEEFEKEEIKTIKYEQLSFI
jgi:hypothetical protein